MPAGHEYVLGTEGEQAQVFACQFREKAHTRPDTNVVVDRPFGRPRFSAAPPLVVLPHPGCVKGRACSRPLSVTRISAFDGSRSIFWRKR